MLHNPDHVHTVAMSRSQAHLWMWPQLNAWLHFINYSQVLDCGAGESPVVRDASPPLDVATPTMEVAPPTIDVTPPLFDEILAPTLGPHQAMALYSFAAELPTDLSLQVSYSWSLNSMISATISRLIHRQFRGIFILIL